MSHPRQTDYLVIGGGSGGCAAARILADRLDGRVVVLESGGTNNRPDVTDPRRWAELLNSDVNWDFATVAQKAAGGRVHRWPMGKVLGGSSSVNGMKYMRGGPWDYDRWVQLGADGWGADEVYRVYRDMEDYPQGDQRFHGTGGPISLVEVIGDHPLTAAFLSACDEKGYKRAGDFNSFDAEGYGTNQLNIRDGRREDAGSALIGPYLDDGRVEVLLGATAQRLIFDASRSRVRAVEYQTADGIAQVEVTREVVLCAGAINSPHLLMLSGIGRADELRRHGISVVADLPGVGANLHDHIGVPMVYESLQPIPPSRYQSTEVSLYLRGTNDTAHFDMQVTMHQFPAYLPPEYACGPDGFTFFPGTLKPRSRGTVGLRSADPNVSPLIDPAYLTHLEDVAMLVGIIEVVRDLVSAASFESWRGCEIGPGQGVRDRDELERYVREVASTYFHPAGTCRMGSDDRAVVDSKLRVRGVENLRVADASVMPEIVSGNTNAPAMMIGWRAGEFISADHRAG